MRWKAWILLSRFYTRSAAKSLFSRLPLVLFVVSFLLFAIVMIPSIRDRLRNSRLLTQQMVTFSFSGKVGRMVSVPNGFPEILALPGATVEVGGSKGTTDENGKYELQAQAYAGQTIPIVFTYQRTSAIDRVSVPNVGKEIKEDFTFPQ